MGESFLPEISVLTCHDIICSTQIKKYVKVSSQSDHKGQVILARDPVHSPPQTFVSVSVWKSSAFCLLLLFSLSSSSYIYLWDAVLLETTVQRWICWDAFHKGSSS